MSPWIVLLIIVGVQLFSIGLIGEMITNSRDEQQRYSIKEAINTTIPENG